MNELKKEELEKEIEQLVEQKRKEDELNILKKRKKELKEEILAMKAGGLSETQSPSVSIAEIILLISLVLLSGALVAEHSRLGIIPLVAMVVLILRIAAKRRQI